MALARHQPRCLLLTREPVALLPLPNRLSGRELAVCAALALAAAAAAAALALATPAAAPAALAAPAAFAAALAAPIVVAGAAWPRGGWVGASRVREGGRRGGARGGAVCQRR